MRTITLLGLLFLGTLAGCGEEDRYKLTKEQAKKVNMSHQGEEVVECFGAEGPYAFIGGAQGNPNHAITFRVTVKGQEVKKAYPAEKDVSYLAEFFTNKDGDSFAVVRKFKAPQK